MKTSLSPTPGQGEPGWAGLAGRAALHVNHPLFKNGYALLFSGAVTSALGLLYWALAARLYPAEVVGLNSALLSAMVLLSGIAQLSLTNVLVRFIPVAGAQTGRLIIYAYLASVAAAAVASLVFIMGIDVWSPALAFVKHSPAWQWALGLAVAAWCLFNLQDSVLSGLRQSVWVPIENTLFAAVKLVLLIAFAAWLPRDGIFLSWTIPVILSLLPINALIFWRLMPALPAPAVPLTLAGILRNTGGNYAGTILLMAYTFVLPLIVANQAGPQATAYFYLPWTIAAGVQLIASNLTISLTVEASRHHSALGSYSRRILKQSLRLLVPLVAVLVIGAPWLLRILGQSYALEGAWLLRCLSLAAIPNLVVVLSTGIFRVQNRPWAVAAVHGLLCISVLSLTFVLLPAYGITGVGLAWLISQTAAAGVLWHVALRPLLSRPVSDGHASPS